MTTAAASAALNDRVAATLTEILRLCTEADVSDLVTRINAEVALWSGRDTVLVVAGETNRGKSALINALLGSDVLPADSTRVTGTYVVCRYGEEPLARVFLDGREEPLTMTPREAVRWIQTGARVGDALSVRAVELCVPSPFLESGLTIVDTPGAGGLDAAHGRVTLATLARADALLFVVDPSAPLSAPELAFLQRAAERIDTVLFALTKTDAYRGWRQIAQDDVLLIAQHAPRFAGVPMFPTSARLKRDADELAAAGAPDPELAADSGLPALDEAIGQGVRNRATLLRLGNLLRLAQYALERLGLPHATVAAAVEEDSSDAIDHAQLRLDQFRDTAERAQVAMTDRFNQLRDTTTAVSARLLREVADRYETAGPSATNDTSALVERIETDIQAVDMELTNLIHGEVEAIAAEVGSQVDAPAVAFQWEGAAPLTAPVSEFLEHASAANQADPSMRLRLASTIASAGTSAGIGYGYVQGGNNVGLLMGASAILGVVTMATTIRFGRKQRDAQTLRANLRGALDVARNEMAPILRQRVLVAQREAEAALRSHTRQKTRELQEAVNKCQQLARADAAARQRARTESERQLASITRLQRTVDALYTEVDQQRRGSDSALRPTPEVIL